MPSPTSKFPSYGLVRGPSHEQGGVAGMVADEQPVELEGGEWIIPKEAVPDYLPVLQQITNEGRAMQQMDNGNSAMDALIASASMQNGLAQPKSPMYQEGGQVSSNIIPGLLSDSLQIRRPEGFLPPEEKFGYATGAFTTPSRPKDYYDYLENLEDMAAEGEEVRATDENKIRYYLSKFQGSSPTGMSRNPVTGEMESNYARRMRMFGDRSKKEGRYVMGDPRNEELRDAIAVKEYLEQGKSFDKLSSGLKNQVLKRATA